MSLINRQLAKLTQEVNKLQVSVAERLEHIETNIVDSATAMVMNSASDIVQVAQDAATVAQGIQTQMAGYVDSKGYFPSVEDGIFNTNDGDHFWTIDQGDRVEWLNSEAEAVLIYRSPSPESLAAVGIFPGANRSSVQVASFLKRVKSLKIAGVDQVKSVSIKSASWKVSAGVFSIAFNIADGEFGLNAQELASLTITSPEVDSWIGNKSFLIEGASGVKLSIVINFDDQNPISIAAASSSGDFSSRVINHQQIWDRDFLEDQVNGAVEARLASSELRDYPFKTNSSSSFAKAFIRAAYVYGTNKSVYIKKMILDNDRLSSIELADTTTGEVICKWVESAVSSFSSKPASVRLGLADLAQSTYKGIWAVLEIDWTKINQDLEIDYTPEETELHSSALFDFEELKEKLINPEFKQIIRVPTDYTTITSAIASINRVRHPLDQTIIVCADKSSDYLETVVLPDYVSIKGPGQSAVAGLTDGVTNLSMPTVTRGIGSHIFDFRITTTTGNGTTNSGLPVVSSSLDLLSYWGGEHQAWAPVGVMKNVTLVGAATQNSPLYSGVIGSMQHEIFENVTTTRLNRAATVEDISLSTLTVSTAAPLADGQKQVKAATVELKSVKSETTLSNIILRSTQDGSPVNLLIDQTSINLIESISSVADKPHRWGFSGVYRGAVAQTGGVAKAHHTGTTKIVVNGSTSDLVAGRFVKRTGTNTVEYAQSGDKIVGWVYNTAAAGQQVTIIKGDAHTTQISGATASTGAWGISTNGQLSYAAPVKLGDTFGGVVSVW